MPSIRCRTTRRSSSGWTWTSEARALTASNRIELTRRMTGGLPSAVQQVLPPGQLLQVGHRLLGIEHFHQ